MAKLFILFAVLPIIEIALLIEVGEQIGGWYTIAIVILTAFFGARLVRQEGLSTLTTAQQKMQSGQIPGQEMAEGLLLVIAGVLLVTPGFVTDALGFLLSLPITRPIIAKGLQAKMTVNTSFNGHTQFHQQYQQPFETQQQSRQQDGEIIEGEFVDKDNEPNPKLNKPD